MNSSAADCLKYIGNICQNDIIGPSNGPSPALKPNTGYERPPTQPNDTPCTARRGCRARHSPAATLRRRSCAPDLRLRSAAQVRAGNLRAARLLRPLQRPLGVHLPVRRRLPAGRSVPAPHHLLLRSARTPLAVHIPALSPSFSPSSPLAILSS